MATRFYLTSNAADVDLSVNTDKDMDLNRGSGLTVATSNTPTGPVGQGGWTFSDGIGGPALWWWTAPLDPVTITGTITANVWMAESDALANVGAECAVTRNDNAGNFLQFTGGTEKGTELPVTTRAAQNWGFTPSSTTVSAGERLNFIVYLNDAGGTAAGGFTATLGYNGATAAADGDSWVEFTETITEQAPPAPATTVRQRPLQGARW